MSSSTPESHLWAVILAGGIGSRFWPASTPSRPKQLLPIAGSTPLITETVERILPLVPADRLRLLAGGPLTEAILAATPTLRPAQAWIEPVAKGTAPVLAWATARIAALDPDGIVASLHADHVIRPAEAFRELLGRMAAASGAHDRIYTIGAQPTRPETGYGYIRVGRELGPESGFEVASFVEKPDAATAARYVREGYLWNTGIFVWPAVLLRREIDRHTPELARLLPLLDAGDDAGFFARAPSLSIDEGVLERSDRVAVMPADFAWDDVGSWDAVGRVREADADGNIGIGDTRFVDARDTVAWSDDGAIVAFGVEDLVIVRTPTITFVTRRERTAELKELLAQLPDRLARGD